MSIVGSNALAGASGQAGAAAAGFQISRSLRFNSADSAYLNRTPSSAGNRKTWTWSGWLKRSGLGVLNQLFVTQSSGTAYTALYIDSSNKLRFEDYESSAQSQLFTTQVFRDVSAWQHIVVAVDTTQATASNRVKLYVNGQQVTEFDTETYMSQNRETYISNTVDTRIGGGQAANQFLNGYLAEIHLVDGQALSASSFGEYDDDNNWIPKSFTHGTAKHTGDWIGDTAGTPYGGAVNGSDKAFDGDDSTGSAANTGTAFVFTPSTPITGISKVRIRAVRDSSQSDDDGLQLNGTAIGSNWTAGAAVSEVEITVNNLTSLRWETNSISHWYKVYKIEIYYEGAYHTLVQGDINSFHLDFSDNSSNAALGTDSSGVGTTLPCVEFDGSGDYLSFANHADFALGTGDFTVECFVNPTNNVNYRSILENRGSVSDGNGFTLSIDASDKIYIYSNGFLVQSASGAVTENKWYHVAYVRNGSTHALYLDGVQVSTSTTSKDYTSQAFHIGATAYNQGDNFAGFISNVRIVKGTAVYTAAFTAPTAPLTNIANTKLLCCQSSSSATTAAVTPGTITANGDASATSKNDTAWTVNNLTAAGASGSWNQSEVWSTTGTTTGNGYRATLSYPGVFNGVNNSADPNAALAASGENDYRYTFNTAITVQSNIEVYFERIGDGSITFNKGESDQLAITSSDVSTSSGLTTYTTTAITTFKNISIAKHTGPYLIYIKVDGKQLVDSGLSDPTATDIDSLIDTPTNYTADSGNNGGSYCTWNPLSNHEHTASNGNLEVGTGASDGNSRINGTFAASSGKWYFEVQQKGSSPSYSTAGISKTDITEQFPGDDASSWSYEVGQGKAKNNNTYSSTYSTLGDGDILMVAFDIDAGKLWFGKNGTFFNSGDPANGTNAIYTNLGSGSFRPCARPYGSGNSFVLNAGQRSFSYAPPTGFLSLCTQNLSDPTIADGSAYMDVILWTGQGNTNDRTLTTTTSADLVWTKSRSNAYHHALFDTVRGFSQNGLNTDSNNSEGAATGGYLKSVTDTSITLAATSDNSNAWYNGNAHTYVAWLWDAGSSNTSISAGGLNSSAYNQSQTWSNNISGGSGAYGAAANAFDGSLSTNASPEYSSPMTYTNPSASDTVISTFEIYGRQYSSSVTVELNDTSISSQISSTVQWHSITGFTGQNFSKLYWRPTSGNSEIQIYAIRINGKILLDQGATPATNVPSIASTVRANPSAGVSIVSYTGNNASSGTIGHGLNAAPEFIIIKSRNSADFWPVYHHSLGTNHIKLNDSAASGANLFGSVPTSSVFSVGTDNSLNGAYDYIAYCFAPVEGYSAFGSYTGNGSADGPFVYTGFKPAFLLLKASQGGGSWIMYDFKRDPSNLTNEAILSNSSAAEVTFSSAVADMLSNGFKLRGTDSWINTSGQTYIYAAFASHSFKTARAR